MDPALLNYLQNRDRAPMQNGAPQNDKAPYNPFNSGIKAAIDAARESLSMTDKQEEKSMRRALLSFAANNAAQPREKGFLNNFGSISRALIPAIGTYDNAEEENIALNNNLANQIIGHRRADMAEQAAAEQMRWKRQHAENQLAEQRRYHDMWADSQQSREINNLEAMKENGDPLEEILNEAEKYIIETQDKGSQNWFGRFGRNWLPGGIPKNKEQGGVDVLGDVLKGKLFNQWGYRNQAEFNHVPSISSENSPEVNLAIIAKLKQLLLKNHDREGDTSKKPNLVSTTTTAPHTSLDEIFIEE
jgi:hypothetical protein